MYKKISMIMVFLIFLSMLIALNVFCDTVAGWEGYGIYTLTDTDSSIVEENINITVAEEKLIFEGQYIVKNNTSKDIRVVLATPYDNISNARATSNNVLLKYMIRSYEGIKAEYKLEGKIPKEPKWYAFDVYLKSNETKTVKLTFDTKPTVDQENNIRVSYMKDRNLSYCNLTEAVKLNISLKDYKPYNIVELIGIEPEQVNQQGLIEVRCNGENISEVALKYNLVDKLMFDNIKNSKNKTVKEISKSLEAKDYKKAIEHCDEYLNNPTDNQISMDQIRLIKAEGFRLLSDYKSYLNSIQDVKIDNTYPSTLIYKILFDKLMVFEEQEDKDNLNAIVKEFTNIAEQTNLFMKSWLDLNGYKIPSPNIEPEDNKPQALATIAKESFSFKELYNKIIEYRYSMPITLILGLFLGFIIGRATKRDRRRGTDYLFRR